MASSSTAKLSYKKLQPEAWFNREDEDYCHYRNISRRRSRKFHIRRKLRLKIPRFLRRKGRLVKNVLKKVYKRLKESQSHFGDLFAGNYIFMQVTPTPLKYLR